MWPEGDQMNMMEEKELLKMTVGCFIEELVKVISTHYAFSEYTKENIRLIIGDKPLDDHSAPLSDYKITPGTTVQMVRKTSNEKREGETERERAHVIQSQLLLGSPPPQTSCSCIQRETPTMTSFPGLLHSAMASNVSIKQEKCYNPQDPTLRFVDRDDDLDFLCEGFKSPRALMSCGHAVTPTSLTNWCLRLLEQGESRFTCGVCDAEWPFTEVHKMALLTPQEVKIFEKTLAARQMLKIKLCPGCRSFVERESGSDLNVLCKVCTAQKGRPYELCARPRKDRCDNDGCCNHSLKTLETCPEITVGGVCVCPSVRACPTCGLLVEHTKMGCKSVVCPRCKVQFCFVCLKRKYAGACCSRDVAPRQKSIPVWQKK